MTLSFIILAQSVTGAVITIVALLLVAALIGYLTAWFYAKSVYTPIIKGLEAEKADLQKQVAGLKDDVNRLNGKVDDLNAKISKLEDQLGAKEKEIKELKSKIKE
jgi:DNA phosphorothioation-dependent restriction protein DptG